MERSWASQDDEFGVMNDFLSKYPYLKIYLVPICIGFAGVICLVIGIIVSFTPHQEEPISFHSQEVKGDSTGNGSKLFPTDNSKQMVVDVSGAVVRQGIYHLHTESRVEDALEAAGGLSENADRSFVEKKINLAAKLVDGAKLYIPRKGESASVSTSDQTGVVDQSSTININDASADQLDSLPGIGQVTAQKIISGRPYTDIQDLLTKKVVSNSVFNKIKDKVSVY